MRGEEERRRREEKRREEEKAETLGCLRDIFGATAGDTAEFFSVC